MSILGDLKPKFWAYRLHSNNGYYITDNEGDSCDLVMVCDILNAIPALEARLKELEAIRGSLIIALDTEIDAKLKLEAENERLKQTIRLGEDEF